MRKTPPTKAELEDIRMWITECDLAVPMQFGGFEFLFAHLKRFIFYADRLLEIGYISEPERTEIVERIEINIGVVRQTELEDIMNLNLKDIMSSRNSS